MFGNVKVDYKPCKSGFQVSQAADYMLGRLPEQIRDGVIKTASDLYWSFNCDRDNYTRDVLMTRKLFGKRETKNSNLAFKMSISFSPEDSDKLTYHEALKIAAEFAQKFFSDYEVLFAVHTDRPHTHVHFLVGNCHIETGKAFRRNQRDLYDMCEFFGKQCEERGLVHSIRDSYFKETTEDSIDKETFAERQMKAKGKETFKDELREVIQIECADPQNQMFEDVVNALMKHYNVECRVKGNTISYRHPIFTDKNGKLVSVRGSKLGDKYTVKGINNELTKKSGERADRDLAGGNIGENGIADRAATGTTVQTGERLLYEGTAYPRCEAYREAVQAEESTTSTGNVSGTGVRRSAGGSTEFTAGFGADQSSGQQAGDSIRGKLRGSQEGRKGAGDGIGGSGDVPSFEEIFRDYERRNGTPEPKRPAKSKPARAVRKKRQDRGL